jgi:O-antigen/teichoic acid export membrane protein
VQRQQYFVTCDIAGSILVSFCFSVLIVVLVLSFVFICNSNLYFLEQLKFIKSAPFYFWMMVGVGMVLQPQFNIFRSLVEFNRSYTQAATLRVLFVGVSCVPFAFFSNAFIALLFLLAIKTVAVLGAAVFVYFKTDFFLKEIPMNIDIIKSARENLRFAGFFSAENLIKSYSPQIERSLLLAYHGANLFSQFVVPTEAVAHSLSVIGAITTYAYPILADKGSGEKRTDQSQFLKLLSYVIVASVFLTVFWLLMGGEVLKIWMGEAYQHEMRLILLIMALGLVPFSIASIYTCKAHAQGEFKQTFYMTAFCYLISIILAYYLILHFGPIGLAAVWGIRSSMESILLYVFNRRSLS